MTETPQERRNRERDARRKAMKKRQRIDLATKAIGAVGTVIVGTIIVAVILTIVAFLFQVFIWNLGVVGIVAACGGSVAKIGLGTALGAVLLGSYLGNLFSGDPIVHFNRKG